MPHNTRSAAVLKRLGFAVDGYARDYLMIDGRWQDHILTSLLNPDWTQPAT
jgi:ribosomal-protein-alanine N-acetyltransferase